MDRIYHGSRHGSAWLHRAIESPAAVVTAQLLVSGMLRTESSRAWEEAWDAAWVMVPIAVLALVAAWPLQLQLL